MTAADRQAMVAALGLPSLESLVDEVIPRGLRLEGPPALPGLDGPLTEAEVLADLEGLAARNRVLRSYLGGGYAGTHTPAVVRRHILENPEWYTAYTPYQPEISQGRLEALVNFQTLVTDLTGLDIAGASLLDEATAAAEAMALCRRQVKTPGAVFVADPQCHPGVLAVVLTRAEPLGIEVVVTDPWAWDFARPTFGVLAAYPGHRGRLRPLGPLADRTHAAGALLVAAADLLALTLVQAPGEAGADLAVGTSQRFGVPLGFGGPHAGYLAAKAAFQRSLPGRLVGVSKDAAGRPAYRLALQTREQHIRREAATSNICTAQVLLAVLAQAYAVWHGPEGLGALADRMRRQTLGLAAALGAAGYTLEGGEVFDTLTVTAGPRPLDGVLGAALEAGINLRRHPDGALGISLDETVTDADLADLAGAFGAPAPLVPSTAPLDPALARKSDFLTHPTFHRYRTESELMRYLHRLAAKDYSLVHGMIPLGSCTMKLNPAAAMLPITWPAFANLHPDAPADQAAGTLELIGRLERWLGALTGFPGVSLQPNSGAQGEYAGLLAVRAWHRSRGDEGRKVVLIPASAHGTNPASAALAGFEVVVVKCDEAGNVDLADLKDRLGTLGPRVAALMVTYPSTHGVFEEGIAEACRLVHEAGGQVYMDGANMNAQVGLTHPARLGADLCHLNLHKTFAIPHGGGGPGVGPLCAAAHLVPFLPSKQGVGLVSGAAYGSAGVLPIPYVYIALAGPQGLAQNTADALLTANYLMERLAPHYPVLYRGRRGRVAHEGILDLRPLKASSGVEAEDVAKRLMDYGFHAPTLSFPVPGTLMVEPTESESKAEIDRFCDAMIGIRHEIRAIEEGRVPRDRNLLKDAPFPAADVTADAWDRPYTRTEAAWPAPWSREAKFWPSVARVDGVWGDRNLFCTCPPVADLA